MSDYLNARLSTIRSTDVLNLILELEIACGVPSAPFLSMPLWSYLTQCVYPNGGTQKRQPIASKYLPVEGFLGTTIRKLGGSDLYALCEELAHRNHTSLEFNLGQKLVGFLNANLPRYPAAKKPTLQQRRNNVVAQRRSTRG